MRPMTVKHYAGSVGTTAAVISFAKQAQYIVVNNIDSTESLGISFDGGRTLFTLLKGQMVSIPCLANSITVIGVGGTADYCIMTNEG